MNANTCGDPVGDLPVHLWPCEWCDGAIPADQPDDGFCSDRCRWEHLEQAKEEL
jgi:predicted nucleic acid-binding Zn ribbon protein